MKAVPFLIDTVRRQTDPARRFPLFGSRLRSEPWDDLLRSSIDALAAIGKPALPALVRCSGEELARVGPSGPDSEFLLYMGLCIARICDEDLSPWIMEDEPGWKLLHDILRSLAADDFRNPRVREAAREVLARIAPR